MMIPFLLALTVSMPTVDQQGRICFNALRDFQRVETATYQAHLIHGVKDDQWPSEGQHQRVYLLLADVRLALSESLTAALASKDGTVSTPVRSLVQHGTAVLETLRVLTADPTAPKAAKTAIQRAITAYRALVAAFPTRVVDEEHAKE